MKVVLYLLFTGFIVHTSMAAEKKTRPALDPKTTEQGYKPNDFCGVGANKRLAELDEQGFAEVLKVREAQQELNQLNAKKNIIKGFLDLRDTFAASLENITKESEDKEAANIEDFRKLLRSTLAIQAVSALYNTPTAATPDPKKPVTVDSLCEASENKESAFCKHLKSTWFTSSITDPLNQTLTNLTAAQGQLSEDDNKKMHTTFKTVMATLSDRLSPDAVLNTLSERAQTLSPLLADDTKKDLEQCMHSDANDSCKKLLSDNTSRENIRILLMKEVSEVKKSFAKSRQEFVEQKLNDIYNTADAIKKDKSTRLSALFSDKLNSAIKLFEDQNSRQKLAEIGIDNDTFTSFKDNCSDRNSESREKCRKLSEGLVSFFETKLKELDAQIEPKTAELNSLSSTGGSLTIILKMRQYVAQKFLRSCSVVNRAEKQVELFAAPCSWLQKISPAEGDPVDSLNDKLGDVVSRLVMDNQLSPKRGELGPFSKDELKVYENYCSGTTAGKTFQDICDDVYKESNAIKNLRESKDWEEFNKKYWVVPSDKNPKGYDVYEKKGNARIFGEGLSQSVSRIYPTWITNFNLGYQIQSLESQALFLKQMNYMYSPTSPWASNVYFPGSYYTFPTSTNFANPFSTSAGFNFSN